MKYLLDTNILIHYLKGNDKGIAKKFELHSPTEFAVCSVVKSELLYGAEKSTNPRHTYTVVNGLFSQFHSFDFDDAAAVEYAKLRAYLELKGMTIGPYDMQIAAIAIANDLKLVTKNLHEFERIPSLAIEAW